MGDLPPFRSLDFVYVPTADVRASVDHYVDGLGAELVWYVEGMGTTVAAVRVAGEGPLVLLSGHLEGDVAILVYRVDDYAATTAALRAHGIDDLDELEIPHGPVAAFRMPDGQRLAVYELTRPSAVTHFDGRDDR